MRMTVHSYVRYPCSFPPDWVRLGSLLLATPASGGTVSAFDPGAMIAPMDATWQDDGILDAYGFVYALLRERIQERR